MTVQRDYILRMIAQAAAAARRLRELLARSAAPTELLPAIRDAQGELLGRDAEMLRALDPATAAGLLGDPRRVRAWADLLDVEADALDASGASEPAAHARRRARTLRALPAVAADERP